MMDENKAPIRIVRLNPEHGGIRFGVVLSMFIGLVFSFIFIRYLILSFAAGTFLGEFVIVSSCVISIPVALAFAWLTEKGLKRIWPSGMILVFEDQHFYYSDSGARSNPSEHSVSQLTFDAGKRLNLTRWYYNLRGFTRAGRDRTVPDKWLCLACQIQQDDQRLILFSYLSPEAAANWINNQDISEPFEIISMAEIYKNDGFRRWGNTTRPELDAALITGPKGIYWLAERRRWVEGLEIEPKDFSFIMEYIEKRG
jgi:hypothetical protein